MLDLLFLPDPGPSSVVVVLPVDHKSRLVRLESCDDVAPTLVVVHPDSDSGPLALVRQETNNAGRAATTLGESEGTAGLGPSTKRSVQRCGKTRERGFSGRR